MGSKKFHLRDSEGRKVRLHLASWHNILKMAWTSRMLCTTRQKLHWRTSRSVLDNLPRRPTAGQEWHCYLTQPATLHLKCYLAVRWGQNSFLDGGGEEHEVPTAWFWRHSQDPQHPAQRYWSLHGHNWPIAPVSHKECRHLSDGCCWSCCFPYSHIAG